MGNVLRGHRYEHVPVTDDDSVAVDVSSINSLQQRRRIDSKKDRFSASAYNSSTQLTYTKQGFDTAVPQDVFLNAFSFLTQADLGAVARVNHAWNEVSGVLWCALLCRYDVSDYVVCSHFCHTSFSVLLVFGFFC